jgi:hypothetical protein
MSGVHRAIGRSDAALPSNPNQLRWQAYDLLPHKRTVTATALTRAAICGARSGPAFRAGMYGSASNRAGYDWVAVCRERYGKCRKHVFYAGPGYGVPGGDVASVPSRGGKRLRRSVIHSAGTSAGGPGVVHPGGRATPTGQRDACWRREATQTAHPPALSRCAGESCHPVRMSGIW